MRVEADQKELIINKLKEDVYSLKRNEQEYILLQDEFKKLEHRYRLLQDEKVLHGVRQVLIDNDFRAKHELSLKNIGQLKNEVDALRA